MKILLTTIAALLLVGCGESQQSTALTESKPAEPVAEASQPEPTTAKAPDISIHEAAALGNIEAVKQFLDSGTDVNAKDKTGGTPLDEAAGWGRKDIVELLIAKGADVNAKFEDDGSTPLHLAAWKGHFETAELLIAADAIECEDGGWRYTARFGRKGVKAGLLPSQSRQKRNRRPPPQTRRQDGCRVES